MKMKRSFLRAATAMFACAVIASSCKPDTVTVTGVTLDSPTLSLTEGESANLKATVKPDNAENRAVAWRSEKPDVATVDQSGKVTAVKEGTTDITVRTVDGGKTATCAVTVKAKATPPPPPPPPIPVISVVTQPTAPEGLVEGKIPAGTRLTVEASVTEGAALNYQWYTYDKANNEVLEAIRGATGASYTLPTTLKAGDHWYVCEIGATGAVSKRTDPVKVVVAPKKEKPGTPELKVKPGVSLSIPEMIVDIAITPVDVSQALEGGTAPYTYSAKGLPAGLTISPAGVITGTRNVVGTAGTVTVTVTDSSTPVQKVTLTIAYGETRAMYRAVIDITNVPTRTLAGIDLTLTGSIVPVTATNKSIVWSVKNDGGTGATIAKGGNVLKTTTGGTVTVRATIAHGASASSSFIKDFTVTVITPSHQVNFGGEDERQWP